MRSVKMKVIIAIAICTIIAVASVGIIAMINAGRVADEDAEDQMKSVCAEQMEKNDAVIRKIEQSVDTLADMVMQRMDVTKFKSAKAYADTFTKGILQDTISFASHTDGAITAYVRYNPDYTNPTSGIFLTRNSTKEDFESVTPTDFSQFEKDDMEHVGWYYIPVQNKAPIWMDPYLNANINVYMVSYVVPLYDEGGDSIGIVGMDIDVALFSDIASTLSLYDSGDSFMLTASGKVLHDSALDTGADFATKEGMEEIAGQVTSGSGENELMSFSDEEGDRELVYRKLSNGMMLGVTASKSDIQANAGSLRTTILLVGIGVVVLVIIIGFFLSLTITKPIRRLTGVIDDTANLRLRENPVTAKLAKQNDELGKMAQAIITMREALAGMVGNMQSIQSTITESTNELDDIMKGNNSMSEDNSAVLEELSSTFAETAADASRITEQVASARGNSEEIYRLIDSGRETADDLAAKAKELEEFAESSIGKLRTMYETIQMNAAEATEQSKAVEQINELTDNIQAISGQTNLLALNASIEAARAGEAGKGFAVVASEIGGLAAQTSETVRHIDEIVDRVNLAVSNLRNCVETTTKFLGETVMKDYEAFEKVGRNYEGDAEAFISMMSNISEQTGSMTTGIADISTAVDNINEMISRTEAAVHTVSEKSIRVTESTTDGYGRLQENERSMIELEGIINQFEV